MTLTKTEKIQQKYNYGIEVLRIVSMFMVVILHVLGQGGILASVPSNSVQYHVAWLLEIVCYCAVNCYALISGYVMIDTNFKYRKYLLTWLQVFTYLIGITLIFMLWNQQSIGLKFVVESFLPVLSRRWWYFTAYTGVYLIHVHPFVWQHIMQGRFASFATMPVWKMVVGVIVSALVIFIGCLCIEWVRSKVFVLLKLVKK